MKYIAEFYIEKNDKTYEVEFDFHGYKTENLFVKTAQTVVDYIYANKIENDFYYANYELPNIWINGAVGGIWLRRKSNDTYIGINLSKKGCGYIAVS